MNVTIEQVAHEAGVSKATVSRFLNKRGNVSSETARKITEIIKRLDYVPNSAARNLSLGQTDRIGLIIGSVSHIYWSTLFDRITQFVSKFETDARHYETLAISSNPVVMLNTTKGLRDKIRVLAEERVAGMILAIRDAISDDDISYLVSTGIPCVIIQSSLSESRVSSVGIDNCKASYEAARWLCELGHRDFAFVAGPENTTYTKERLGGFIKGLENYNISLPQDRILHGDNIFMDGYWRMKQILSWKHKPSAVFYCNDYMGFGGLKAAEEESVSVPDDLSVMGFDGIIMESSRHSPLMPKLTTVRQPISELADAAVEILMQQIADRQEGTRKIYERILPTCILDQGTCAPVSQFASAGHKPGSDRKTGL